jgi:hypothetical protein
MSATSAAGSEDLKDVLARGYRSHHQTAIAIKTMTSAAKIQP